MTFIHGSSCADVMLGDCVESMRKLPESCINTCVTSPPYFGLRDYGHAGQIGLEQTPDEYVAKLVDVFREVRRVLRDDGTLWLNLGDSYAGAGYSNNKNTGGATREQDGKQKHTTWREGSARADGEVRSDGASRRNRNGLGPVAGLKNKDLIGIPWMVAFALRADGWFLRQEIIWHKPNPMPESVTDRCTKAHEQLFLLSKSASYFCDMGAIKEPAIGGHKGSTFHKGKTAEHQLNRASEAPRVEADTRNRRSVWTIATRPYKGAHFATFPPDLVEPCVIAGCPAGGVVLDPFGGSGTTAGVALRNGRNAILCELNPEYAALVDARIGSLCN